MGTPALQFMAHIETLCAPGTPDGINEDAVFLHRSDDGSIITAAVIDGATVRVEAQALHPLLAAYAQPMTAAALAAQVTLAAFNETPQHPLRQMLINANARLRAQLESVYGGLTPDAVIAQEPGLMPYVAEDARYFRLALPACVVTLARINLQTLHLEYAHLGDSGLMVFAPDGGVRLIVGDDNRAINGKGYQRVRQLQQERGLASFIAAMQDDEIRQRSIKGGVYHNYVDANGAPQPGTGIGVINGLPQMALYMQTGTVALEAECAVLLCTDGLPWPAPANETPAASQIRLRHMRDRIHREGLHGYYTQLRAQENADPDGIRYPRAKRHDDASGIILNISHAY